jgi:large subunit ribosomal protein L18
MKAIVKKNIRRQRRKKHVRRDVHGTAQRPRLTVFRSHKNLSVQLIDDEAGRTVLAISTLDKQMRPKLGAGGGNCAAAKELGAALAAKATQAGIQAIVFDRNGYRYHGRVKHLAEAARQGGLKF